MANLTIQGAMNAFVAKFSDHNMRINAAQESADKAASTAASALRGINLPDGTSLQANGGVVTLPATPISGLSIDPATGLAQVAPSASGSSSSASTVTAAIAGPNIVQPL